MRGLIVDNFAGGGGASTGIEMATGRSVDIAINHDEDAIAMHETNHPQTLHYCENVFDVDPVGATGGRSVDLCWFSPDCTHFSKARGGTPVKKEIRALAWVTIRWALKTRPRVIAVENVEEFQTWGPLLVTPQNPDLPPNVLENFFGPVLPESCQPDPGRAGETFHAFCAMLSNGISAAHPAFAECCDFLDLAHDSEDAQRLIKGLGYAVEYRVLRACDYGAPTIRKRFFMLMRCDGVPIRWPEASHGDPNSQEVKSGKLQPWRTAAECIDFSIPALSIFGRKKPLAENTLRRIARGIQRFVIDNPSPFIVKCNHTGKGYDAFRGQSLDEPLQTITQTHGYAVAIPHLTKFRTGATGQEINQPVPTITAGTALRPGGNGHALGLVEASLAPFLAGAGGPQYSAKPRDIQSPVNTVCRTSHTCLITPIITRQFGRSIGHSVDTPSATLTTRVKSQLISPTLIQVGYGERDGQQPRVPGLDKPLGTVVAGGGKHALVSAFLSKHFGGNYSGPGVALQEPFHSVTAVDHHALVASHLIKFRRTGDGQTVDTPMPTVTAGGQHIGEVRTFLEKYCGAEDNFLVRINGEDYQIVDICMRMLQPRELYRAQGFPEWYVIEYDSHGRKYAKHKQIARCGNAVPPPFAEALVRANLPELCVNKSAAA